MADERSPDAATPSQLTVRNTPSERTVVTPSAESVGTQPQLEAPTHLFENAELLTVPGYTVSREIAHGGMGVVYLAHDPAFDREVALKVMHVGQDAVRFVIEAKVTAQLPHPGVPPVHAIGTLPDGRPFLAMKFVRGRTLASELKATELPRLLGIFEQICQTVGFAHSQGIIHRDLKPSNVMVGAFGEVLVMDWGLARVGKDEGGRMKDEMKIEGPSGSDSSFIPHPSSFLETQPGQIEGTPAYMAPEQARGDPVDARADVFALGGILAVMLTGQPPFVSDTVTDTVQKAARAELNDCFALLDRCADAGLVGVAQRCLAANANDRYASGSEVAAAVAAYRVGVEERLRRAERDRAASEAESRELHKRRKVQLTLVATVGVFLTAAIGYLWWQDRRVAERRIQSERVENARTAEAELAAERQQTEARNKVQQARDGVRANRALATELRKQYKFKAAGQALAQAVKFAESGAPEFLAEVQQAQRDITFVAQLDEIRYRKWTAANDPDAVSGFNTSLAPQEYRRAFTDHELNLELLDPAEAARRIAASEVKTALVAAVDDWALYEPNAVLTARLLDIARRADPGPWTDRLRTPSLRNNIQAVANLAATADLDNTPPATLIVLATVMERCALSPAPLLSAARIKHPSDFELAFALGLWHGTHSKYGQQIGPYEAARALRPENAPVWNNLGNALDERGERDAAIAAYNKAILLDPGYSFAHNNLGVALAAKGNFDAAIVAYRAALKLNPNYVSAHNNLGNALSDKGDRDGAIAAYKKAIELDSNYAPAHNNLGNALKDNGDVDGAIAAYNTALKINPRYVGAHSNLGVALYIKGNTDGAIASYLTALRIDPNYAPAHNNMGNALKRKGDLNTAITAYTRAIMIRPNYPQALNNLGDALEMKGDRDGAIAFYKKAIEVNPRFVLAYVNLGMSLASKGDADGALAAYKKAIEFDPQYAIAHNNLAWLFATGPPEVRDAKRALEHATKACELTQWKNASYLETLGGAYAESGDFEKAIELVQKALSFPNDAKEFGPEWRERLELYSQKKPYRDLAFIKRSLAPPPREVKR